MIAGSRKFFYDVMREMSWWWRCL